MIQDKKKAFKIFTLVNLSTFCIYLILGQVIKHFNLEFIDWIHNVAAINIIGILYGIIKLSEGENKKSSIAILIAISIFISGIAIFVRLLMSDTEHIVYKNGKILVITVSSFFTNTCVTIYESKFLILKKEIGDGGTFDGAYDPFERGEVKY